MLQSSVPLEGDPVGIVEFHMVELRTAVELAGDKSMDQNFSV